MKGFALRQGNEKSAVLLQNTRDRLCERMCSCAHIGRKGSQRNCLLSVNLMQGLTGPKMGQDGPDFFNLVSSFTSLNEV